MIGIGAIISIAASIFQAVQASNRSDASTQKPDQPFSQFDAAAKESLENGDLLPGLDKTAPKATINTDQLFSKLDTNNDGTITREEFSSAIDRLTEQLDQQYMRLRMHGEQPNSASNTQNEPTGSASNMVDDLRKTEGEGSSRINTKETANFVKSNATSTSTVSSTLSKEIQNAETMLQVMRLIQTYGTVENTAINKDIKTPKISTSA